MKYLTHEYDSISYSSWISRRHSFIFIENPKVASTKIKMLLQKLEGYSVPDSRSQVLRNYTKLHSRNAKGYFFLEALPNSRDTWTLLSENNDFFKFSFVRNPYERLFSVYKSKIESRSFQSKQFKHIRKILTSHPELDFSFAGFVRFVCQQEEFEMDSHWKVQSRHLFCDLIKYDYIGHLENFCKDMSYVIQRIGGSAPEDLRKKVNFTGAGSSYREAYTRELSELVFKKFEEDFYRFGYKKKIV